MKKQQILVLGRLGWSLRRIEEATGIRRETAGRYLKSAGITVRRPGGWGHSPPPKPAIETSTDVSAAAASLPQPGRSPQASACEAHREFIEVAVRLGRDAMAIWQDLVDDHGFAARYASVKRFVLKLRGQSTPTKQGMTEQVCRRLSELSAIEVLNPKLG